MTAWTGLRTRAARAVVERLLRRVRGGTVAAAPAPPAGSRPPVVRRRRRTRRQSASIATRLTVHDPRVYERVIRQGSVGLGESYADGWWDADDLTAFLRLTLRNLRTDARPAGPDPSAGHPGRRPVLRLRRPDPARDARHVRAHYDLGNDFFAAMLDETMAYSCAVFDRPGISLADASRAKFDRLARLLDLQPGDRLLEIGTGWAGFALHAAQRLRMPSSPPPRSRQRQYEHACARVADAGLDDRITVLDLDYRDLRGTYDKAIAIEMIEAVDWRDYARSSSTSAAPSPTTVRSRCRRSSRPTRASTGSSAGSDFIKAAIFPGGCLPSVGALTDRGRPPTVASRSATTTTSACTTPRRCAGGGPTSTRPVPTCPASGSTTGSVGSVALLSRVLRGRLRRALHQHGAAALRHAGLRAGSGAVQDARAEPQSVAATGERRIRAGRQPVVTPTPSSSRGGSVACTAVPNGSGAGSAAPRPRMRRAERPRPPPRRRRPPGGRRRALRPRRGLTGGLRDAPRLGAHPLRGALRRRDPPGARGASRPGSPACARASPPRPAPAGRPSGRGRRRRMRGVTRPGSRCGRRRWGPGDRCSSSEGFHPAPVETPFGPDAARPVLPDSRDDVERVEVVALVRRTRCCRSDRRARCSRSGPPDRSSRSAPPAPRCRCSRSARSPRSARPCRRSPGGRCCRTGPASASWPHRRRPRPDR